MCWKGGYSYDPAPVDAGNPEPRGAIDYQDSGWLGTSPKINPGTVWWLLYSARWGQDVVADRKAIKRCWDSYWKAGMRAPAVTDPDCRQRDAGYAPFQDEVSYALFLLDGQFDPPFDGFMGRSFVTRWTMHDAP